MLKTAVSCLEALIKLDYICYVFKNSYSRQSSGGKALEVEIQEACNEIPPNGIKQILRKFFIWQAIVRGQSVSTEGPFFF
jgi:hypothetical protein